MNAQTVAAPRLTDAYRAMLGLERYLANCTIERSLRDLIKLRVSQINGCAFCIDMHWQDARGAGESEQRLYSLPAWRECPYYSQRERAALMLAEELTRLPDHSIPESVHGQARETFDEQEIDDLIWTIASINAWNRYSIGSRKAPAERPMPAATN